MKRHKNTSTIIRKTIGMFIAALFGFLSLAAVSAYWGYVLMGQDQVVSFAPVSPVSTASAATIGSERMVKAYFSNSDLDKGITDCTSVYPVVRAVEKKPGIVAVAKEALDQSLRGPFWDEANSGYYTSINAGVKINSLTINNGVAHIDLDQKIEAGLGGSCRVAAIRAQIISTLKQFREVSSVVIAVDGHVADALQP